MSIQDIKNLIDNSTILTDPDRAFWRSQLPTMTPEQMQKLEGILTAAANVHMEEHVREYFTIIRAKKGASQPAA
jgi:hypothetical protein